MNFGELKAYILAEIGRAPSDLVYELVRADVNQKLRALCMEATTSFAEAASVTLPADFIEVKEIYRDTNPRRYLRPAAGFESWHNSTGIPREYLVVDGALQLNPEPNGSETLQMRYYAKVAALSADGDTNDVLTNFPAIYVYGALTHHATMQRDQANASAWFSAYRMAMQQSQSDTVRARSGGPTMQVRARATA